MSEEKKAGKGLMKPMNVSKELEAVVGAGPMPRTEVTKKLWVYIKENNLQDENDKRTIVPDDKLAAVFGGKDPINMFAMTKVVSGHLS